MSLSGKRAASGGGSSGGASKRGRTSAVPAASLSSPDWFDVRRARCLTNVVRIPKETGDCVVLWMSRDQRADDNWAMLYARWLAKKASVPLLVCFNLVPEFLVATIRQFGFMLRGLEETDNNLRAKNIPLHLLRGDAGVTVPAFAVEKKAIAVVCDMSVLRVPMKWTADVAKALEAQEIPLIQVDAHNVVPVWVASDKQEYAARTLRPKIDKLLSFLTEFPALEPNPPGTVLPPQADWTEARTSLRVDQSVKEVTWVRPGAAAANEMLKDFIDNRLKLFGTGRNDPNIDAASGLSPFIHFGQLSSQRAVLNVKAAQKNAESTKSFVEEIVVRKELADNFCFYNTAYDTMTPAADWAAESLRVHTADPREHVYTRDQFEFAKTHDDLWNAAQLQMTTEGKMHGFLRMYWAKKILEWTATPAEALAIAIYLNDKYELDGRDPNGYVGCAWSIYGLHDMGWTERPIFGKIRYMNYAGCQRKWNVGEFVARYPEAIKNCKAAGGTPAVPKKTKAGTAKGGKGSKKGGGDGGGPSGVPKITSFMKSK